MTDRTDNEDDDYEDYELEDDLCPRCDGDGRDPWTDYLLPCPYCQTEQIP